MKKTLRIISLIMLIVAIVFVFCSLSNPEWGKEQLHTLPKISINIERAAVYVIIMVALFVASFFVKKPDNNHIK